MFQQVLQGVKLSAFFLQLISSTEKPLTPMKPDFNRVNLVFNVSGSLTPNYLVVVFVCVNLHIILM